jgi:hypothetical protein
VYLYFDILQGIKREKPGKLKPAAHGIILISAPTQMNELGMEGLSLNCIDP